MDTQIPVTHVNPDDIEGNFWGKNWLCLISRTGEPFLINAANLQDCVDYLIDYIDESGEYEGFINRDYSTFDEYDQFLTGGNCGYELTVSNYRFIDLSLPLAGDFANRFEVPNG